MLPKVFSYIKKPFSWFWQTRRRNKAIVIVIILVAAFFIIRQVSANNNKPNYITAPVKRGNVVQLVSETGNVSSGARTDVYSPSTGVVEEVYVKNNQPVEIGAQLFQVKSSATEAEKATALANYLSAKNNLDTANAMLYTLQSQLFAANQAFIDGKGSKEPVKEDPVYVQQNADWLASEANYKKQQGVISAAQASLNAASLTYQATQNTVVKATANGSIANLSLSPGDMVTAKGVSTTAVSVTPALIIISEMSEPMITLALNEVDIPKVSEGETVEILLDAFPGKTFTGMVKSVDAVGQNNGGIVTYNVAIGIQNADKAVKPGMTANVDIAVDKATDVLTVPNAAIKPYKGKKAVQVIDPKTKLAKFIPVVIGIKSPEKTEIKSGVAEGTVVITGIRSSKPAPIQ